MSKEDIISLFKSGDYNKAVKSLYKETLPKIKRLSREVGASKEDALDVFQEAIIVLIRKIKLNEFLFHDDVDGFIYVISKRMLLNKRVRDKKMQYTDDLEHQIERDAQNHQFLLQKEKPIETVLSKMGEQCKAILWSVFVSELKAEEIIEKLDISNKDVLKTLKSRCKKKLTKILSKNPELVRLLQQ